MRADDPVAILEEDCAVENALREAPHVGQDGRALDRAGADREERSRVDLGLAVENRSAGDRTGILEPAIPHIVLRRRAVELASAKKFLPIAVAGRKTSDPDFANQACTESGDCTLTK
jgi:hypothetical protein